MSRKRLDEAAKFAREMGYEPPERVEEGPTRDREWDRKHPVAGLRLSYETLEAIDQLSKEYDYSRSDMADALLNIAVDALNSGRVSLTFYVKNTQRISSYIWRGRNVKRAYREKVAVGEFRWLDVDASDGQ